MSLGNLDVGRSVTYPFEDQRWRRKLLILLLLAVIPGLNWILWNGYALSIGRNIMRRNDFPMPHWETWSDIAVRGFLATGASLLYFLPAILVGCCFWALGLFLGERANGSFVSIQCCAGLFVVVYVFAVNFLLNSGHVAFARSDRFSSYLNVGARLAELRQHPSLYFTLTLVQAVIGVVVAGLVVIASAVITFVTGIVFSAGAVAAVFVVPAVLLVLIGLLVVATGAFLANGYFVGVVGVLTSTRAK
jgi:hypothetical protein